MLALDYYAYLNRWRWYHPIEKVILVAGLIGINATVPPWPTAPIVFLIMSIVTIVGAGIPLRAYLKVLALPIPFLTFGILSLCLSLGADGIAWNPPAFRMASDLALRTLAAFSCLALLTTTTPLIELLGAMRLPPFLLDLCIMTYRFTHVAWQTVQAIHLSQTARAGYVSPRQARRSLGLLAAALLHHVLERVRRLEYGLSARAYEGRLHLLSPKYSLSPLSLVRIGIPFALVGGVSWYCQ